MEIAVGTSGLRSGLKVKTGLLAKYYNTAILARKYITISITFDQKGLR